ncbi:Leucine-rich repeat serine/threonine-protein kinase 2 [Phytophthora pseudosyringae]|uniref:Leucine-rich repeat serine/threonine-protein kinase 2 n=1 Tax=Phytophthora pseudosyringae TaxID=221518 RepID=A0A8T1VMH6_9STRA|nr:Leucine-rich repeat serine/threonine-protein kinase 2 [Phytophthora pseudosyringae]
MWAAYNGEMEMVQYLAECGSDVNFTSQKGDSALMKTASYGRIEIVRYLAEQCDADVNAMNVDGDTAFLLAARHGRIHIVVYLVEECDANVNTANKDGYTAFLWATLWGQIEVVRYLVEVCGVDVHVKTNMGETAVRIAADHGFREIQWILTPLILADIGDSADNAVPSSGLPSGCSIPPSEIELTLFSPNNNIGGDFYAKWLDADVVVKLFIPDASHSSFEDEVRMWQQLRHPNVIKMYGACAAEPNLQFFVCEYASKGSLIEPVEPSLTDKSTLWKHLHEAALGLEYLHERGTAHGDLRCSNILIGSDGLAKLSNFGLSGLMKRLSPAAFSRTVGATRW